MQGQGVAPAIGIRVPNIWVLGILARPYSLNHKPQLVPRFWGRRWRWGVQALPAAELPKGKRNLHTAMRPASADLLAK